MATNVWYGVSNLVKGLQLCKFLGSNSVKKQLISV